ncbi:hypothetical protein Patl1_11978 [Pistacia atlantica]|uniref:Uncharacterized protein n=1 Tax=Pistacia atlantica TaxID=434234 RepID=A0ACC1A4R6_9ROSI|nr:hypothetical protein Patl1_11978 [Pistacia atlantica]
MHSFGYRANALLTFAVTVVALMCDIASLSDNFNTLSLTAEIQEVSRIKKEHLDDDFAVMNDRDDKRGLSVSTAVFDGVKHLIAFGGYNGKYNNEWLYRLWYVGSGKIVQTLEPKSSVTSAEKPEKNSRLREKVDEVNSTHGELSKELQSVQGQLVTERSRIFKLEPKWNDALLDMFRINYIGTSPSITCLPSLYHHQVSPMDKFLILSSDGLYQYFTYEEAVSEVELFIAAFPKGDPAQHLIKLLLTSMSCLISHK